MAEHRSLDPEYEILLLKSQKELLSKLLVEEKLRVSEERKRRILLEARLTSLKNMLKLQHNIDINEFLQVEAKHSFSYNNRVSSTLKEKPSRHKKPLLPQLKVSGANKKNIFWDSKSVRNEQSASNSVPGNSNNSTRARQVYSTSAYSISNETCQLANGNEISVPKKGSSSSWLYFVDVNGSSHTNPSIPNIFSSRKISFIQRSNARLRRLQEAKIYRQYLGDRKRRVAAQVLDGHVNVEEASRVLAQQSSLFPPSSFYRMARETYQRVRRTGEFRDRISRAKRERDALVNRLLGYCYSQMNRGVR